MQWHAKNKFMRKYIAKVIFCLKECGGVCQSSLRHKLTPYLNF
jgi:hypothetical protein